MKIVINHCYGGFGLSEKAMEMFAELKNTELKKEGKGVFTFIYAVLNEKNIFDIDIPRNDLDLVKVVEMLKEEANGESASLVVREIPDDVDWSIQNYDGIESIHEVHRIW